MLVGKCWCEGGRCEGGRMARRDSSQVTEDECLTATDGKWTVVDPKGRPQSVTESIRMPP